MPMLSTTYPYKGKFYPRIVRTLINAFKLNENSLLLDLLMALELPLIRSISYGN